MIKAGPGHVAYFEATGYERKPFTKRIEAWDDDGHPMVVNDFGLVRADSIPDFNRVDIDASPTPFAFIPGDGWVVEHDDGSHEPLVAWAMCSYGGGESTFALPVVVDDSGSRVFGGSTSASPRGGRDGVRVVPLSSLG